MNVAGWLREPRVARVAEVVVGVEVALAIALIVYVGCQGISDVFVGVPPTISSGVVASCVGPSETDRCDVTLTELNRGRYRVATTGPSRKVAVVVSTNAPSQMPQLLVRVSHPESLKLATSTPVDDATAVELI